MELNNLSPFELEKIIEEATHILNILSHSTTINSNLADKESPVKICPFCGGKYNVRNGHKNGAQRFYAEIAEKFSVVRMVHFFTDLILSSQQS